MVDRDLIEKIRQFKESNRYTLHDLSKIMDISVSTLERWFKTCHINKVYANMVRERIGLK